MYRTTPLVNLCTSCQMMTTCHVVKLFDGSCAHLEKVTMIGVAPARSPVLLTASRTFSMVFASAVPFRPSAGVPDSAAETTDYWGC